MSRSPTTGIPAPTERETTDLLIAWSNGDPEIEGLLLERLYPELRRMAASQLRQNTQSPTLDPTELTHEAYLKLVDQRRVSWQNRAHFFAVAARLVRRILLNHLRDRSRDKRGGGWKRVHLAGEDLGHTPGTDVDLVALSEALDRLAVADSRAARVVELRYFTGLTVDEVAEVLHLSPATVAREWRSARIWLRANLS